MEPLPFVFMADCQLGCYATFSGMSEHDVGRLADRDMQVEITSTVNGFAWDTRHDDVAST